MHDLLEQAVVAYEAGEACVLCTVVRLEGSGYGRPGARLFLSESGDRLGFISGGCLEKDLCRRVWDATATGPKLIAFDTSGNSVDVPRYNTGCEGVVYVLCQRIEDRMVAVIQKILQATSSGCEIRLLTIYRSESKYAQVGDTLLMDMDGGCDLTQINSVDGVCQNSESDHAYSSQVTAELVDKLRSANRTMSFAIHDFDGDVIEAAIEIISPPRRLVIFGSGNDVIPVSTASVALDWRVTVVGHRAELTQSHRFPGAEVLCGPMHEIAEQLIGRGTHFNENTDVVIMTHDFDRDVELMDVLLDSPVRSIGLLGPKRRLGRLVTRLHQRGRKLSDRDIARTRSPLGLDIGAISPAEIATSIVAELIAISRDRDGGFLHERRQPIHGTSKHERIIADLEVTIHPEAVSR
jgi:xanthine dehydrogenase accessory factor